MKCLRLAEVKIDVAIVIIVNEDQFNTLELVPSFSFDLTQRQTKRILNFLSHPVHSNHKVTVLVVDQCPIDKEL